MVHELLIRDRQTGETQIIGEFSDWFIKKVLSHKTKQTNHSQQTKQTDDGQAVTGKVNNPCLDKTADTLRGCGKDIGYPNIKCGNMFCKKPYLCDECKTKQTSGEKK